MLILIKLIEFEDKWYWRSLEFIILIPMIYETSQLQKIKKEEIPVLTLFIQTGDQWFRYVRKGLVEESNPPPSSSSVKERWFVIIPEKDPVFMKEFTRPNQHTLLEQAQYDFFTTKILANQLELPITPRFYIETLFEALYASHPFFTTTHRIVDQAALNASIRHFIKRWDKIRRYIENSDPSTLTLIDIVTFNTCISAQIPSVQLT